MSRLFFTMLLCGITSTVTALAQDNAVYSVLQKIRRLQSQGDTFYPKGLIPSQRWYEGRGIMREDNNIFFTAITVYTLQASKGGFTAEERMLADSITATAQHTFAAYRNKQGDVTYNFWPVQSEQFFPNDPVLSKHRRFKVPDDLDVTAMVYLASDRGAHALPVLKQKMEAYANGRRSSIKSTLPAYRNDSAYTTWFGQKMEPEFDICVLANALLLVQNKGLAWTAADSATARLMVRMVQNEDHLKAGYLVSPSYQSSAVILYHLSRLLAQPGVPLVQTIRPRVVQDLRKLLQKTDNKMTQLVLLSSLIRLGEPAPFTVSVAEAEAGMGSFVFFKANLLAISPVWMRKLAGQSAYVNYSYRCDAYSQALIAEYLILQRESKG